MLFVTCKRLNLFQGCQVKLSLNGSPINTTTCYKYLGVHLDPTLNFDKHFIKCIRRHQQDWISYGISVLALIPSAPNEFTNRRLRQYFTYCGYNSLGWSESRKRMILSIETTSLVNIYLNCSPQNCDLRFLKIYNFLQRQRAAFYLTALKETDVSHLGTTSNDYITTL